MAKIKQITDPVQKFYAKRDIIEKYMEPGVDHHFIGRLAKSEGLYWKSARNSKIYDSLIEFMNEHNITPKSPFPENTIKPNQTKSKQGVSVEEMEAIVEEAESDIESIKNHADYQCDNDKLPFVTSLSKEKEDLIIDARIAIERIKKIDELMQLYVY